MTEYQEGRERWWYYPGRGRSQPSFLQAEIENLWTKLGKSFGRQGWITFALVRDITCLPSVATGILVPRATRLNRRFPTTWPRNDGLWGREWAAGVMHLCDVKIIWQTHEGEILRISVRSASLFKEFYLNQGSRKTLLTLSARFFIVLIVSFIRKMTERKRALLEFWQLFFKFMVRKRFTLTLYYLITFEEIFVI